ncbi:nickel pincer cofactor biosynthesis protein LarC [Halobiforma nitratireducens]|uniref:Putative nickel insertion protein n=1 Tax=Halobiforma nitratireducens JCM 10879 TaxID=1227454 RepID=M0MP48_9EURY|nr:nickel pincer cofactor biosynthesis protein LarC [Halobiforma nitratireducens]EMA47133.1 hypothetical protein C446_00420 [Halobiforma nitratireducens JCM 10879]
MAETATTTTRTLAFDGRMGASGDMILASLLDAGADPAALEAVTDELALEYRLEETVKCGIAATSVDVFLTEDDGAEGSGVQGHENEHEHEHGDGDGHEHESDHSNPDHDHDHDHGDDHSHSHDHSRSADHSHSHDPNHGHSHDHDNDATTRVHAEGRGPHRSYLEVREIVERMALPEAVERDALAIFELLGEAEASVHGDDLAEIHFHEVGADDAIADVVGAATLIHDLDVDRVVTTPLSTGGGTAAMAHGEFPVPTPAVVEIAERADWSLRGGPVDAELLTPTGAAILGYYADGVESLPSLEITASGYGAGGYDLEPHPNVLRVLVGDGGTGELVRDDIAVLETNLDDATPEVLGGLQETLSDVGARDVSVLPATMKKSRPGHLVKIVCKPEDRRRVARALAEETGTLGVREAGATHRWIAERSFDTVDLEFGDETYAVTVKVATDTEGTVYDISTEYEDAKRVASSAGVPIRTVIERAEAIATGMWSQDGIDDA